MATQKFKVGDYVEVVGNGNAGVEIGEQGMVMDSTYQESLCLVFPASGERYCAGINSAGWRTKAEELKLVHRFTQVKSK